MKYGGTNLIREHVSGIRFIDGTMHNQLMEAVKRVQQVAKANNKNSGAYSTAGAQARQYADQGFQMISAAKPF